MAPRANWKGFLRLSLVTCPIALYPATSDADKISFNQINRKTGHRIKYVKVDADTGRRWRACGDCEGLLIRQHIAPACGMSLGHEPACSVACSRSREHFG